MKLSGAAAGWEVTITDNGQGFEQSGGDELFEPFVQAPGAAATETSGLGLGLAIVKRIVELHGGRVVANSAGPARARRSGSSCLPWLQRSKGWRSALATATLGGRLVEDGTHCQRPFCQ